MFELNMFPLEIQQYLKEYSGNIVDIKRLNGIKSDGGCYRILFSHGSIILKKVSEPEYLFYTECRKSLKEFKRHIPDLYFFYNDKNNYWIVIEDIQEPLPKKRWYGDEELIKVLSCLHREMWNKEISMENYYIPKWNDELTHNILRLTSAEVRKELQPILIEIQNKAQRIFKPHCWINGDTNPTNWGINKDGRVILFDWERISCSSPAIDLAITIPGLGTSDNHVETLISKRYLETGDIPFTEEELLQEIKLAKFWSVAEFLGNNWKAMDSEALTDLFNNFREKAQVLIKCL